MTFDEAQRYLLASYKTDNKKGLKELGRALEILGNPQDGLKIIHVAGTNGKGSVCAMLGSVLAAQGYRAGCFTSPHLEVVNERFTINGQMIGGGDFARHMAKVAHAAQKLYGPGGSFSFFEILTLIALDYFCESKVDFLLFEVGIGGRLDATNVIKSPILTIIMSIGMDHMEVLGDTVEKIAEEKAGIIKENCPVVLYPNPQMVYNVIAEIARTKNAKIYHINETIASGIESTAELTKFFVPHEYFGEMCIELSLIGHYQMRNALTAIEAAAALARAGYAIDACAVKRGLATVKWGGRMEIVAKNPMVVLEGAHNLQGAEAAARDMAFLFADKKITLLTGVLMDKEHDRIVRTLAAGADKVVFTKPLYDFKAVAPGVLAKALDGHRADKEIYVVENCLEALQKAIEITCCDDVIFCSGSLYLVGDIRGVFVNGVKDDEND